MCVCVHMMSICNSAMVWNVLQTDPYWFTLIHLSIHNDSVDWPFCWFLLLGFVLLILSQIPPMLTDVHGAANALYSFQNFSLQAANAIGARLDLPLLFVCADLPGHHDRNLCILWWIWHLRNCRRSLVPRGLEPCWSATWGFPQMGTS